MWPFKNRRELWKQYALALEVVEDCDADLADLDKLVGYEGCMTLSRRRELILQQRCNAVIAVEAAREKLVEAGEYK